MERRQFPRKPVDLPVICVPDGSFLNRITGKAVDISQGGLGLRFDRPFDADKVVTVRVIISDASSGIDLEAEGKIAWHRTLDSGEGRMGIDFTKVAWTRLKELLSCV